jgi:hypothetical protein
MKPQDLLIRLNQKALADFALTYREHNPKLASLAFTADSLGKDSIKHIFAQFLTGLRVFTGNRTYDNPAKNWELSVVNQTGDKGMTISVEDIMELASRGSDFDIDKALESWIQTVALLGKMAKDYPFNHIAHIIENGTSGTPLAAFGIPATIVALDGQPLFSATHAYDSASGSLTNIQVGTGTSQAQLEADLVGIIGLLQSMTYSAPGAENSEKRFLNDNITLVNIHCPAVMLPKFRKLKAAQSVSVTGDNVISNTMINEIIPHPFTDVEDWYAEVVDAETPMMRPFVHQLKQSPRLDTPSMTDESVKQNDMLQYGVRTYHGIGIAAFWKLGKVAQP